MLRRLCIRLDVIKWFGAEGVADRMQVSKYFGLNAFRTQ
jgi:hypothetical protein